MLCARVAASAEALDEGKTWMPSSVLLPTHTHSLPGQLYLGHARGQGRVSWRWLPSAGRLGAERDLGSTLKGSPLSSGQKNAEMQQGAGLPCDGTLGSEGHEASRGHLAAGPVRRGRLRTEQRPEQAAQAALLPHLPWTKRRSAGSPVPSAGFLRQCRLEGEDIHPKGKPRPSPTAQEASNPGTVRR